MSSEPESIQTVIIGAGQAGLSVGYFLARRGIPFVILEANERVGDSWRNRWDSLRLFTPARFDALAGMPFPGSPDAFPTKNEMADYLASYVTKFKLPVRTGVRVDRVSRRDGTYLVEAGDLRIEADHVVVAMADFQKPRVPSFANELSRDVVQLHSSAYRSPSQLAKGSVLLVGAGNSGAEIAVETARSGHTTWMSGPPTGEVPFRIGGFLGRHVLARLVMRFVFHRVMTIDTPMGRKARPKIQSKGAPLIRTKSKDLAAAGVERVARTVGVRNGRPLLEDGRVLDAATVIWCTGYHPGFSWIDLPVFDATGKPMQYRGVVHNELGLYFVGLNFLYAMSSTMIHGVERDAEYIADAIVRRARAPRPVETRQRELAVG
jgi:putative flavoprotein involved in K+ transport